MQSKFVTKSSSPSPPVILTCFISASHLLLSTSLICLCLYQTLSIPISCLWDEFLLFHSLHPYLVSSHPHTFTSFGLLWECFLSPLPPFPFLSLCLLPSLPPPHLSPLPSMSPSLLSGGFNALWKWTEAMKAKQDKFGCLMWLLSLLVCLIGSLHLCVCASVCLRCCVESCSLCAHWYACTHTHAHSLAVFFFFNTESSVWPTHQLVLRHVVTCSWSLTWTFNTLNAHMHAHTLGKH